MLNAEKSENPGVVKPECLPSLPFPLPKVSPGLGETGLLCRTLLIMCTCMIRKFFLSASLAIAVSPLCLSATSSAANSRTGADLPKEYEQVRKIAMRDEKVRRAYEKADAQLDSKIIELDPALAPYVKRHIRPESHQSAPETHRAAKPERAEKAASALPPPPPKPFLKPLKEHPKVSSSSQKTHTMIKGETLGAVATKYHVTLSDLRRLNHIQDDRKLVIGQVLLIPPAK